MDSRALECGSLPSHCACVSNNWPAEPCKSPALNFPIPCVSLFSASSAIEQVYRPSMHQPGFLEHVADTDLHRFHLENVTFNYIFRRAELIYKYVSISLPPILGLKNVKSLLCLHCLSCMWKCGHIYRQAFWTWMLFVDRLLTGFSAVVCIFPSSGSSAHCVGLQRWFEAVAFVGVAWWCPLACHVKKYFNLDHRNGPWICLLHKPDTSVPSLGHIVWENPSSTSSSLALICTPWHAVFASVYVCTHTH